MTVLSHGARSRRGGRRPGWLLLTALLVLAIAASSALVFTNRVELLKLAVILALWAAVVAAFVSVIYRRQSDADAAKARDLKMVYDLQLDREISARREYELTVEAELRRELASELRAQSADEVAALRAELAALRNNLEILFETELAQRPAIETERTTVRAYSDWARVTETTDVGGRGSAAAFRQEADVDTGENRIIDVHEEPLGRRPLGEEPLGRRHLGEEPLGRRDLGEEPLGRRHLGEEPGSEPRGRRHAMDYGAGAGVGAAAGAGPGAGAHRLPSENGSWAPLQPEPQPVVEPGSHGVGPEPAMPTESEWAPVAAEGQWLPAGTPGSHWAASGNGVSTGQVNEGEHPTPAPVVATETPVVAEAPRGRHAGPAEGATSFPPSPMHEHAAADRVAADAPVGNSQHGEGRGQSVAELLARLQATPTAGGRRRRREN